MAQRLGVPLLVAGVQLAAAAAVLGRPSFAQAADFFVSRAPTMASAIAASQLTVWAVVLAATGAALALAGGAAATRMRERRRRRAWAAVVMLAGLLILSLGVGHQVQPTQVSLGGGTLQEAQQQLAR